MAQPPPDPTHVRAGPVERGDDRIPVQGAEDSAVGSLRWVRTHVVGTVVVLEVAGRLSDVVADLDLAIRLVLADGPRGVVCDLTAILEDATPGAVKMLARAGRHGRDWPAIPVAVVCPDPWVRAALNAHPVGRNLIVTPSMTSAVSAVLATPHPCCCVTPTHAAPDRAARCAGLRHSHATGLGLGQRHSLRILGGQRTRNQLDDACRHRH